MDMGNSEKFSSFDEIKQQLDPAYSYLILEKTVENNMDAEFEAILTFLSPYKEAIETHEIFRDKSRGRMMLIVRLVQEQKDHIIREILKKNCRRVSFFIFMVASQCNCPISRYESKIATTCLRVMRRQ